MQCDDVARLLPEAVDGDRAVDLSMQRHIESCLRCQAELARYRKMLRGLQLLRTRYLEPGPGLLPQTLAALEKPGNAGRCARSCRGDGSPTRAPSAAPRWRPAPRRRSDRAPVPPPRDPVAG